MTRTALLWTLACAAAGLTACTGDESAIQPRPLATPPCPDGAVAVAPGVDLQARLDAASDGAVLRLLPGHHDGPITVRRSVTLWGDRDAVVRSSGSGTTIDVTAAGAALLGFTVDGSGGRFDLTDGAVRVRADGVRVAGLRIEHALFGILAEKCNGVEIRGNRVAGTPTPAIGMRGDAVRIWEVRNSIVADNYVTDGRDVVVWYSSDNRITGNTVLRSRYGTHLMYSHDNVLEGNQYCDNVVGVFLMYSRGVTLRDNLVARSLGAAGLGLGLKESGNVTVANNAFIANTTAIRLDNSPLNISDRNVFENNDLRMSDTAVVFNGIAARSTFRGNLFRDNNGQVRVDGGDDAQEIAWVANYYDDYRGYDLDGDGTGDVPYELRSLAGELTSRYPDLAFFRGSPTLALVDISSEVFPLFEPKTVLVDESPRMYPEVNRAH